MNRFALTFILLISLFFTPRQTVYAAPATSLLLTASPNPVLLHTGIDFTAVVTSITPEDGIPSGTVTFWVGENILDTAQLNPTGTSEAQATIVTASLPLGTHTITAAYDGDGTFTGRHNNSYRFQDCHPGFSPHDRGRVSTDLYINCHQ